ncbi:MAG: response regulator transcription factor [Opitutaceae bacterium]
MGNITKTTDHSGETKALAARILIIDDHPLMREGIARWINSDPHLDVCGEASDAAKGMKAVSQLKPDLVLCDIGLGSHSGLELLKDLKALHSNIPVIMLSMYDESVYAMRSMRAGARGYVMKKEGGAEVVLAIKEVLAGGSAFSRQVTNQVMAEYAGRAKGHQSPVAALTDREFEILQAYGRGNTSGEIAKLLSISPKTVGAHRNNICHKLELKSSAELIRYAVQYAEGGTSAS